MQPTRLAKLASLLLCAAGAALAAPAIYQCGPGQYSERPCSGGTPYVPSQAVRQPTAEERKAAIEVARRDRQLGRDLQAQRERLEREGARRTAASLSPKPDDAQHKDKPRKKRTGKDKRKPSPDQQDGDFRAVSPAR